MFTDSLLSTTLLVLLGLAVVLGVFVWASYNSLVQLKVRVEEAWSDITVQLKRRTDLIPNIVNTVKGYTQHESDVFAKVGEARERMLGANGAKDAGAAENAIEGALKSLFAIAEAYPDLKANENYIQLQQELSDTEDKIQAARRFYNGGVSSLNTKIQMFPTNLIAGALGFTKFEFFEVEDQAEVEKPVEVKF